MEVITLRDWPDTLRKGTSKSDSLTRLMHLAKLPACAKLPVMGLLSTGTADLHLAMTGKALVHRWQKVHSAQEVNELAARSGELSHFEELDAQLIAKQHGKARYAVARAGCSCSASGVAL